MKTPRRSPLAAWLPAALLAILAAVAAFPPMAGAAAARPYVVNGTGVDDARHASTWPFMVAVHVVHPKGGWDCGGSIIHPRLVVTAAHCVVDNDYFDRVAPANVIVGAGAADQAAIVGTNVRRVRDVLIHPKFKGERRNGKLAYDIAVLRLASPLATGPGVAPIPIVAPSEDSWWGAGAGTGTSTSETGPLVAGWGNTVPWDTGHDFPSRLRETHVPILSDDVCRGHGLLTAIELCAGAPDSDSDPSNGSTGRDTCKGDSGGPLIVSDGGSGWRLAAITSWGSGPCGTAVPGAYTRLAAFRTWVSSIAPDGGGAQGIQPPSSFTMLRRTPNAFLLKIGAPRSGPSTIGYSVYRVDKGVMRYLGFTRRQTIAVGGFRPGTRSTLYAVAHSRDRSESPARRLIVTTSRR